MRGPLGSNQSQKRQMLGPPFPMIGCNVHEMRAVFLELSKSITYGLITLNYQYTKVLTALDKL
jgi:hypothetical protein